MLDHDEADPTVERIALALRRPVDFGPDVDRAVMSAIRAAPLMVAPTSPRAARATAGSRANAWRWLLRPRPVRLTVSPIGALAAAGIAVAAMFGLRAIGGETGEHAVPGQTGEFPIASAPRAGGAAAGSTRDTVVITRFIIAAPSAHSVALVGDFNDWDHARTPLVQVANDTWSIELPLTPGRYQYAFLVDGKRWMADPGAPRATGDDFGRPNSVLTVSEGKSA